MNVLHVITGLGDGGAQAVLYGLCRADTSDKHRVVSLMDAGKYGDQLERAGVSVDCLRMPQGRLTLRGVVHLWRLLRTTKPDVVQTWMYHADLVGGVLARLAGIPRVYWGIHHSTLAGDTSRRTTVIVARLNAWLSRCVPTGIVCCAESARRVHEALGYAGGKLTVIPNGYDLSLFRPDPESRGRLRAEWGLVDGPPVIGMVARFHVLKDHANLLNALGQVRRAGLPFRCVLVGSAMTADNRHLAAMIEGQSLGDRVMLLGQRSDVAAVMAALDMHVLPSREEAFPNVLAEAMACGTPCVTTDVGDAASIVGSTGWIVPPGDPVRLAEAIEAAVAAWQDKAGWQRRKEAARERIEARFRLDLMVSAYRALWSR